MQHTESWAHCKKENLEEVDYTGNWVEVLDNGTDTDHDIGPSSVEGMPFAGRSMNSCWEWTAAFA